MALKRMVMELGMGTDLRGEDYTKASIRAIKDALWHNSLTLTDAFGFEKSDMIVKAEVAVAKPELVDTAEVAKIFPYGQVEVTAVAGGLDVPSADGTRSTVIANAAVNVYFVLQESAA